MTELQNAAVAVRARITERLGNVWWTVMSRGLILVGLGLVALFWPGASIGLLVRLLALVLILDGIAAIAGGWRAGERGTYLLAGAAGLLIGIVLLVWPVATSRLAIMLLGLWAVANGASLWLSARSLDPRDPDRGTLTTIGAIAAVVGAVLLLWPGTGIVTLAWVIGIGALVLGGLLVWLATRLKAVQGRVATAAGRRDA
jgi:uncharacterized membrane protein HdeD (DUF308 family)